MSGLVGIWNLDGRPVEDALLARMSATLAHRGPDGEGRWMQGPAGLACQNLRVTPESANDTQPLVDPRSGAVLVFDGRLDNREELADRLETPPPLRGTLSDAAWVLRAYQAAGTVLPQWLAGDFAFALFDPRQHRLLLARDAIGMRPLYYSLTPRALLFASEIKALLAHPQVRPEPDEAQLAGFLLARRYDPAQTFFAGIASVPPAHAVLVGPRGMRRWRYWDFDPQATIRLRSFEEYTEAFRGVFEQAVARRLRSARPVAVFVSGGLDSSSIFGLAHTLLRRAGASAAGVAGVSCSAQAGSAADEQVFVQALTQRYPGPLVMVPRETDGLLEGAAQALWHLEMPLLDAQRGTSERLFDAACQQGARVVLTGHWGDQVFDWFSPLVDAFRGLAWGTLWKRFQTCVRWTTDVEPAVLRSALVKALVKSSTPVSLLQAWRRHRAGRWAPWYTAGFCRQAWRQLSTDRPAARRFWTVHAGELYQDMRSGYQVLGMEWSAKAAARHGLEIAFPYLDRELLSFLMAIPPDVQLHQGIPRGLLRAALQDVLPDSITARRWKGDTTAFVNASVHAAYPRLVRALTHDGEAVRRGYLDPRRLAPHLKALNAGLADSTARSAWALTDLLGLEQWLRVFFGNVEVTR